MEREYVDENGIFLLGRTSYRYGSGGGSGGGRTTSRELLIERDRVPWKRRTLNMKY